MLVKVRSNGRVEDLEGYCGRSRIDAARVRTILKRQSVLSTHRTTKRVAVAHIQPGLIRQFVAARRQFP